MSWVRAGPSTSSVETDPLNPEGQDLPFSLRDQSPASRPDSKSLGPHATNWLKRDALKAGNDAFSLQTPAYTARLMNGAPFVAVDAFGPLLGRAMHPDSSRKAARWVRRTS